jgi:hypothetical protein
MEVNVGAETLVILTSEVRVRDRKREGLKVIRFRDWDRNKYKNKDIDKIKNKRRRQR